MTRAILLYFALSGWQEIKGKMLCDKCKTEQVGIMKLLSKHSPIEIYSNHSNADW